MGKLKVDKIATLEGHRDSIFTVIGGRTPSEFFSGSGDGMVVAWDLQNPEDGHLIAKMDQSVYALCKLPDNQHLVVGHNYEGVHIIDLTTRKEISSLKLQQASIFDIQYTDGRLYVGHGDGSVTEVSWPELQTLQVISLTDKSARTMAIQGNHLAIGYSDWKVRVLDVHTQEVVHILEEASNSVFTVHYSPDKNFLLAAGRDAHLRIYDVRNGYQLVNDVVAHMYAINHIAFSPTGAYFATCSMDKSIKVWDAASFKLLKVIDKARHAGHGTSVNKLHWSAFQDQLVSCSDDRTLSVWDITADDL